ncbi:MAG TPA: phytoene/squalene synthase family protein [Paludibacteraceae bacterium]|nr:phytoene/squalene synthase family protein [Paludibacteraceae bacterium]
MMELYTNIAFKTSELVTKTYSTSFSIAISCLPYETKKAIYAIYGFVRFADEIVDTFEKTQQKNLIRDFEADYQKALETGISMNPILHAFVLTIQKYNIPLNLVDSFLHSMKLDLDKQIYTTDAELREYIYGSADVVGLMCLHIFVNGDKKEYDNLLLPAKRLGSAFQKVNFLRDLKADYEYLGRAYFPDFSIETFNEAKKRSIINDMETDFIEARKGISELPGKTKLAVYIAYLYFYELLKKIKKTPVHGILEARIRVSDTKKIALFAKAYIDFLLHKI